MKEFKKRLFYSVLQRVLVLAEYEPNNAVTNAYSAFLDPLKTEIKKS